MAKFRDTPLDVSQVNVMLPSPGSKPQDPVLDRSIGEIIRETRDLTAEQVEEVLKHQKVHGVRFGEAAVALGFATADDVLYALAQQFHYPYAAKDRRTANPELVALNQPFSHQAETFRAIRSQLTMRLAQDKGVRSAIAVVSPNSGDGKTFLCANLAITLAQLGGKTLLVDADMRGPRQHEVFGIESQVGLSGILSGRSESQVVQQVVGVDNLFLLPVGITPPNPLELVERPAFSLLMRELCMKFDHVIVDTPAAIYGADASVIAAQCGNALVVARKDVSRVDALNGLAASVAASSAKLVGVIVNEF